MTSLLLIKTIILIFIQNSWCDITIEIKTGEVDVVTEDTSTGGSSTTERAIVINQTLKCISEKAIKSKVDAANETQDAESKRFFNF